MAKDLIKEGVALALGVVRISGEQFNKVIKQLEKRNKVSSKEGKTMVYKWVSEQQKQLEKMRRKLKKEVLRTKLYSSKDLSKMNQVIKNLSKEIVKLQKKKKKAEAVRKKERRKALKKRTAKRKPAKKKAARKPAKKRKKRR
jgi:polyhydroxyalkanoate synthesis regulator phasin